MTRSHSEPANERSSPSALSDDERYRLLSAERRRTAVDVLEERTLPIGLDDLAAAIAEREADDTADADAVERVAISLHHVHLPKLVDAGVIRYDPESNRIE